jgi:phage regulator Rha-like protein
MSLNTSLVTIENNTPLADSRQIAEKLGIDHRSFFKMITEYEEEVSKDFGQVRFEIAVGYRPQGGGNPLRYALLTEDQSYVYLAYSQNTEQARQCKRLLVKAFAEARAELSQAAPALIEPSNSFRYELRLVVTDAKSLEKAREIIAQAEQIQKVVNMSEWEEQRLHRDILRYIDELTERFKMPTARDLSRYILYADVVTIKQLVYKMVKQGVLVENTNGKSPRYQISYN